MTVHSDSTSGARAQSKSEIHTAVDNCLTMSTLEIAGLAGKRHADVLRDSRKMLKALGIPERNFAFSYRGEDGKDHPIFNLPKRETLILVSGYSVEMRARIIDRWMVLEAVVAGDHEGFDPEIAAREFGMVKSLVRDLTALRKDFVALHEEHLAARRLANGAVSSVGYKFAVQIADDHGVHRKGRGRLVPRMGRQLLRFCRERGWPHLQEYREDGMARRYLFSVEAVAAWLREEGHAMIAAHLAGVPFARSQPEQGVLRLVPR